MSKNGQSQMTPTIEYISDHNIDDVLDQEIRTLLRSCFTKPCHAAFKQRRYLREPYPHCWTMRDIEGSLIAHAGVHEKMIIVGDGTYPTGGICAVCVHPDCRGRGHLRRMLEATHEWLSKHGFAFSVLFGRPEIYASSGYVKAENLFLGTGTGEWKLAVALVRALSDVPWPNGRVLMHGDSF